MNTVQSAPLLDQNPSVWYGVSVFGIVVLECAATVHMVHAQTRLLAAVHVCMMCTSGATNSFLINASYIKAQPMACLVNSQSCGGASGCCMLVCYPSHFRFLGKKLHMQQSSQSPSAC